MATTTMPHPTPVQASSHDGQRSAWYEEQGQYDVGHAEPDHPGCPAGLGERSEHPDRLIQGQGADDDHDRHRETGDQYQAGRRTAGQLHESL